MCIFWDEAQQNLLILRSYAAIWYYQGYLLLQSSQKLSDSHEHQTLQITAILQNYLSELLTPGKALKNVTHFARFNLAAWHYQGLGSILDDILRLERCWATTRCSLSLKTLFCHLEHLQKCLKLLIIRKTTIIQNYACLLLESGAHITLIKNFLLSIMLVIQLFVYLRWSRDLRGLLRWRCWCYWNERVLGPVGSYCRKVVHPAMIWRARSMLNCSVGKLWLFHLTCWVLRHAVYPLSDRVWALRWRRHDSLLGFVVVLIQRLYIIALSKWLSILAVASHRLILLGLWYHRRCIGRLFGDRGFLTSSLLLLLFSTTRPPCRWWSQKLNVFRNWFQSFV